MKNITKFKLSNKVTLLFILLLASILRFYKLDLIPFTHDEFSALFRTQFDSFSDLIKFGVVGDGHPAGIQIFLYYIVKLFGINSFFVKLPFTIFGILSVLFTYLIAKSWFNETVGLISAVFITTLQFPVIYSQIARPYISGLFFSLVMVYYWSNYVFKSNKKIDRNIIGFLIGAILCSYNHYFSLLFAIIVGITGLFFVKKRRILYYISSGVLIFIFFIPHLKITFFTLSIGGLSWLGKPNAFFFTDYIKYIFHSSVFIGILIFLLLIISYFFRNKIKGINKYRIIALLFFILPFLIGFIYSIFVKPVIQFSVLIFSFPFLIILLTSYLKEFNSKINLLIVVIISTIISLSLIIEKKHYYVFYQSGFSEIFNDNNRIIHKYPSNVTSILSSNKKISNYYLKNDLTAYSDKDNSALSSEIEKFENNLFTIGWNTLDSINRFKENASIKNYKTFLASQNSDYLYYGWAHNFDRKILHIIPNYYPYLIQKKNFFHSETYLFSKKKPEEYEETILYSNYNGFEEKNRLWSDSKHVVDSIAFNGNYSSFISKDIEFSTTFSAKFNSILKNDYENILASVKFYSPVNKCSAFLVFSIENRNKKIKWHYVDLNDFIDKNQKWQTANLRVQIDKIHFPFNKNIKVFIWNLNKEEFFIDDFSIKVFEGNKNRFMY
ncbi:MAG: hypothetical protein GQ564_12305 [Bacteroidales bacterium]|nr:hypothetical protein [Bacteroidales bacterium]